MIGKAKNRREKESDLDDEMKRRAESEIGLLGFPCFQRMLKDRKIFSTRSSLHFSLLFKPLSKLPSRNLRIV